MIILDAIFPEKQAMPSKAGSLAALLIAVCAANYLLDDWPISMLWPFFQRLATETWGDSVGNLTRNLAPMVLVLGTRIALVFYAASAIGLGEPDIGWSKPKSKRWVVLGVLGALTLMAFNAWGLHQLPEIFSRHRIPARLWVAPEEIWAYWSVPWVMNHFVLYWLTSALGEELFYRGFLFGAIRRLNGARTAIFWTTLIFAINHFHFAHGRPPSVIDFADHALAGALFGWLREREGTLWAPFAAHAAMQVFATWFDWLAAY